MCTFYACRGTRGGSWFRSWAQLRDWGRLNGSLLICLRKDVADVSHCVPGLGTRGDVAREKAHFMCTFYACRGTRGGSWFRSWAQLRDWGRLNGSLLFCLRKDVADVSHCVPGLGTR